MAVTVKPAVDLNRALRIISRAWGKQSGYCFFPHIDREEQIRTGERRAGFHENRAFKWPEEKGLILEHMAEHIGHDLYWCPSLFETPERKAEDAMDEHALWADMDEGMVGAAYSPHENVEYTITEPYGVIGHIITWNSTFSCGL